MALLRCSHLHVVQCLQPKGQFSSNRRSEYTKNAQAQCAHRSNHFQHTLALQPAFYASAHT